MRGAYISSEQCPEFAEINSNQNFHNNNIGKSHSIKKLARCRFHTKTQSQWSENKIQMQAATKITNQMTFDDKTGPQCN